MSDGQVGANLHFEAGESQLGSCEGFLNGKKDQSAALSYSNERTPHVNYLHHSKDNALVILMVI